MWFNRENGWQNDLEQMSINDPKEEVFEGPNYAF